MSDMQTRRFALAANSYNAADRTFEAVISTGAPVARRDARGPFVERLNLSSIDTASLIGLTVLDGHRQTGSEHAVGSIIEARREGDSVVAKVRLSAADDVKSLATKIEEGTLRGVSIGYSAEARSEATDPATGKRTVTISPRIHELSIVAIPADPLALIRKETSMPPENEETATTTVANDNTLTVRQEIRAIARTAGLNPEWADAQIDAGADVTTARAAAFESMMTRTAVPLRTQVGASNDEPAIVLQRRTDALAARVLGTAPDDASRQYFTDGLADHARAFLTMAGQSVTGMDRETILRSAQHTTSDFVNLLTGVGNRVLAPGYQAAQSPLKSLARQALHNDFRTNSRLKLGEIGQLEKVSESGEIQSTSRSEAIDGYALDTYGSLFALSRKAMVNDDLGAFRDWGMAAGRAAAETEANLLVTLLTQSSGAGPIMGEDGVRMFHADHGNLAGAGAAPGESTLSAARLALRTMTGLDGVTPIAVTPKFLLIGPETETTAEKLLATIAAATTSDVNPFAGRLTLLVEPRITDGAWYVFADPSQVPVLEYAYLSSAQGPQMASREGWDVLGVEFRVVLDFGCGALDWRGAYRNPGA